MPVAAIYDIHGNLPALEAVLADIERTGADEIVVGGDVLPGPMPRQCLAALRAVQLPVRFIRGNGEREVLAQLAGMESKTIPAPVREAMRWVGEQLEPGELLELRSWPPTTRMTLAGLGRVLFCHASPRNDTDIFTRRTPDDVLWPLLDGAEAEVIVCGHTHMQFDRTVGAVRLVNAGSVGMPFGAPGAYWALLGPRVELRRTAFDLAHAAAQVRATQYPEAVEFAAHNILEPPTEAAMLDALGKAEVRPAPGGERV